MVTLAALVIGIAGLGLSAIQVATGLLPRKFTPAQQGQIMAWEVAGRWREMPAGAIFPATTTYPPPEALNDGGALTLTTRRLGIAHGRRRAVRRLTSPSPRCSRATAARRSCAPPTWTEPGPTSSPWGSRSSLAARRPPRRNGSCPLPALSHAGDVNALAAGLRAASFAGTPAARFTDTRRQLSGSLDAGPYVLLYTIGYADGRPTVPVGVDGYTYAEMDSMGTDLASLIAGKLSAAPPVPNCPGAAGC